jgi:hypothetical protein
MLRLRLPSRRTFELSTSTVAPRRSVSPGVMSDELAGGKVAAQLPQRPRGGLARTLAYKMTCRILVLPLPGARQGRRIGSAFSC